PDIEIMRPLRSGGVVLLNGGGGRRIVEEPNRRRRNELERRWHEIARITGMDRRGIGRLPDSVHARANLIFVGDLIAPIKTQARVEGQSRQDPPFVLKVNTIKAASPGAIIDDVNWHD